MPITITRRFEFDAGHRVLGHEGKCRHLHGHRYAALVEVQAQSLDPLGRVVDFSVIKSLIGGWIDEHWDHNLLLHSEDPLLQVFESKQADFLPREERQQMTGFLADARREVFADKDPYVLPSKMNPTAEHLALVLFNVVHDLLPTEIRVKAVRMYETPNCFADYRPRDV